MKPAPRRTAMHRLGDWLVRTGPKALKLIKGVVVIGLGGPAVISLALREGHHTFALSTLGMFVAPVLAVVLAHRRRTPRWMGQLGLLCATASIPLLGWMAWLDYAR